MVAGKVGDAVEFAIEHSGELLGAVGEVAGALLG